VAHTESVNYVFTDYLHDAISHSGYQVHHVDTDILYVMVNITNTNSSGNNDNLDKFHTFLPSDE
jgi:hypothetical protein